MLTVTRGRKGRSDDRRCAEKGGRGRTRQSTRTRIELDGELRALGTLRTERKQTVASTCFSIAAARDTSEARTGARLALPNGGINNLTLSNLLSRACYTLNLDKTPPGKLVMDAVDLAFAQALPKVEVHTPLSPPTTTLTHAAPPPARMLIFISLRQSAPRSSHWQYQSPMSPRNLAAA